MNDPIKPTIVIQRTNTRLQTENITYNEAGRLYNDNIAYGGLYGSDIAPIVAGARASTLTQVITSPKPLAVSARTNVRLYGSQVTYNESGLTYDSAVQYGGLYGYDITPLVTMIRALYPSIRFGWDRDGIFAERPIGMTGMPMGLLLALTYWS